MPLFLCDSESIAKGLHGRTCPLSRQERANHKSLSKLLDWRGCETEGSRFLMFFSHSGDVVKTFTSFDGIRIAYHDEGEGPAVVLLHGGYVDGLGRFG